MLIRSSGFACAVIFGFAAMVLAQAAPPREQPRLPPGGNQPGGQGNAQGHAQAGQLDEGIATCIALGNQNEIEISKFARERLKSEEARNFADMMIKEHTQALQRIEKFAGHSYNAQGTGREGTGREGSGREGTGREGGNQPGAGDPNRPGVRVQAGGVQVEAGGRPGANAGANANHQEAAWNQIKHEIAAECLASARRELEQAQQDADKCYIGLQVAMHMKMADELKVFSRHASQNLRGELQAELQATQKHLAEAKRIMESYKGQNTSRTGTGGNSGTGTQPQPRRDNENR